MDFAPVCHYYDAALWMSRFSSRMAALFPPEGIQLWPFAVLAALALVVLRLRRVCGVRAALSRRFLADGAPTIDRLERKRKFAP